MYACKRFTLIVKKHSNLKQLSQYSSTSSQKVRVTQDVLLKMFQHTFELKLWDTKDKVSAKARFDRPKAFRLPQNKNQDEVDLDLLRNMLNGADNGIIHLGTGSSSLLDQNKGLLRIHTGLFEELHKNIVKKCFY